MARVALQLAYDGSAYAGFQVQRNAVTVHSLLERALFRLYGRSIVFKAAGRTDAGVHARGQLVHFDPPQFNIPTNKLPFALNPLLPKDIRILRAYDVSVSFHARFDALRRTYVYTLYQGRIVPPHLRHFAAPWLRNYNFERMQHDAQRFVGTHDFRAFAQCDKNKHTVRTVHEAYFKQNGEFLEFVITANGFLRKMVRSIVGSMCEWEKKRLRGLYMAPLETILAQRDRSLAGKTAPAQGLCLHAICYEEFNTETFS